MKHARLSASSSERWLNCTGSVALCDKLPKETKSTSYAYRGTVLHKVIENYLLFNELPPAGSEYDCGEGPYEITDEDLDGVLQYLEILEDARGEPLWEGFEITLDFTDVHKDLGGTADFALVDNGWLTVLDFKSGRGVMVNAHENTQALQYAVGVLSTVPPEVRKTIQNVRVIIVQPWASFGPIKKVWETDLARLIEHVITLWDVAEKIYQNPTLTPGDWCRWCPANLICPKLNADFVAMATEVHQRITALPSMMTVEQIGSILSRYEVLKPWLAEVYKEGLRQAEAGGSIPGMKLVPKRASRKWDDPDFIPGLLESLGVGTDAIYTKKVVSPPQAEKNLGKKFYKEHLEDHVQNVSSGYNLVPVTDEVKGPDLTPVLPNPLGRSV